MSRPRRRRRGRRAEASAAGDYRPSEASYEWLDGEGVTVRRLHDTLKALGRCGTRPLEDAERRAGRCFQDIYEQAQLDQPRALDPDRPGGGGTPQGPSDSMIAGVYGRRELERALAALGGTWTVQAQVVLAVLGEGRILRQAGETLNLGNGRAAESAAKWLLIGALGTLAAHFGFAIAGRARKKTLDSVR